MHDHNDLCSETSCIFGLQKTPMEESLCLQSCLSATRIWFMMMSPDPQKNKVRKLNIPAAGMWRMLTVSHFSDPVGLSGGCRNWPKSLQQNRKTLIYPTTVSFKRAAGSKDVGVMSDIQDKGQLQTIGGSAGTKAPTCAWVKAGESES